MQLRGENSFAHLSPVDKYVDNLWVTELREKPSFPAWEVKPPQASLYARHLVYLFTDVDKNPVLCSLV
jgi:hypothetical protein